MRPRTAHRIVSRVQTGKVKATSYTREDVIRAFETLKVDMPDALLKPWDDADAERERVKAQREADAPLIAERKAAKETKAAEKRAVKDAKAARKKGLEAQQRADFLERFGPQAQVAAAAGREAFQQAVEGEIDELPESIELEEVVTPAAKEAATEAGKLIRDELRRDGREAAGVIVTELGPAIDGMNRDELRAECKRRKLTRYSSLNKDGLIAMLKADDGL
jgi:hypothetical protein